MQQKSCFPVLLIRYNEQSGDKSRQGLECRPWITLYAKHPIHLTWVVSDICKRLYPADLLKLNADI